MILIGYSAYQGLAFQSSSPPIRNINFLKLQNSIVDEIKIDEDIKTTPTSTKDSWNMSTRMLCDFVNSLEAGNIYSQGLEIIKLNIKRRKTSELNPTFIGSVPFENNTTMNFDDFTCPTGDYVYSISPVLANNIEGVPNEINVESEFTGWYIVDKNNNNVQAFDTYIDSEPTISAQLNQGRTVIETLNKYSHIYYDNRESHSFSLNGLIIADEFKKVGQKYEDFLNKFVRNHIPLLCKSADGRIYICDVYTPQISSPMNTWSGREYAQISINLQEIQSIEDYMVGE